MKWIAATLLSATGLLAYLQTGGQSPSQDPYAMVTFSLKPNIPGASSWSITSYGNGDGTFSETGAQEKPVHFSPSTTKRLAQGRATIESRHCETKAKNIAQTGEKHLTLALPPNHVDCTFNYTDDPALQDAADAFMAVAETIQTGEKLARLHRFDRLGLDPAMKALVDEVKDGRAIEIRNIASTLQSLIDDDRVLERVRREAAELLNNAK